MKKDESLLVGAFKINMYRSVLPNFQIKSKSGDIHPFLTEKNPYLGRFLFNLH
jgi:hypothetical protein